MTPDSRSSPKRRAVATLLSVPFVALLALPALAHHSFAMFDFKTTLTLEGTVKQFQWTNPHAFVVMLVPGAEGSSTQYSLETLPPSTLMRIGGWKHNSLKPGDRITVQMHPLRDGRNGGALAALTLADGRKMELGTLNQLREE